MLVLWHFLTALTATVRGTEKIAFLFLTRGHLPLENVWREFFNFHPNKTSNKPYYNVYVHVSTQQGQHSFRYPNTSFFHGKEIAERANIRWAFSSKGVLNLLRTAYHDDHQNEWFCLVSDSCIPIVNFPTWRRALLSTNKSLLNACLHSDHENESEVKTRFTPELDRVNFPRSKWRKSSAWWAMTRKHAGVILSTNRTLIDAWVTVPVADEHFLPSILALNGLDNETVCNDAYTYNRFDSLSESHPKAFQSDDITEEFLRVTVRNPASGGAHANHSFSSTCLGLETCHLSARKFVPNAKFSIYRLLHLLLGDGYDGNPYQWSKPNLRYAYERRSRSRKPAALSSSPLPQQQQRQPDDEQEVNKYFYLLDMGTMREVADVETVRNFLRLNESDATEVTAAEKKAHRLGQDIYSTKDGTLIKISIRRRETFYLENGTRREIYPWMMDTLFRSHPGTGWGSVTVHGVTLVGGSEIPLGKPLYKAE